MLTTTNIAEVITNRPDVFAFVVTGPLSSDDLSALARRMDKAFDTFDSVNMLLIVSADTMTEGAAWADFDLFKAQFRALGKVERYATVGAPDRVGKVIEAFSKIMPVDAKAFSDTDENAAWDFVGARPEAA